MHDNNFQDPNAWSINWYHWHRWYSSWKRSLKVRDSTTLKVPQALLQQTGEWYEVNVQNRHGFAKGVSRIIITEGMMYSVDSVSPVISEQSI